MNRKQRRASRHGGVPTAVGAGAAAAPPKLLEELLAAAVAQHRAGAFAEAERSYQHILSLFPDHAVTRAMLGVALSAQGKFGEAIPHLERIAAQKPNGPQVYDDLARAYFGAGRPELAMQAAAQALGYDETDKRKAFFAFCAKSVVFHTDNARLRKLVQRAFVEGWARPRELAHTCTSLIKLDHALSDAMARAMRAWPKRLSTIEPFGTAELTALARNELLRAIMETDPVTDLGLERVLTNVRSAMLNCAAEPVPDQNLLAFYCAVARQCFINEYVFSIEEAEAENARALRAALEESLAAGGDFPAHWLAIVGAYFPLHALAGAQALLARSWPPAVDALVVQQVKEPADERRIAPTIPALTAIDDPVSMTVRQHYEESPYPRWAQSGPPGQPAILNGRWLDRPCDVLIAGCGTGLSATEFARHARTARVLAVDLSLSSLSYAKRMAQNSGLTNIEFAQADIMRLGALGRTFDFIDSSGVLHHLADPWAGWRILLSLLRPGGAMEIGLYSERARRNVVAARAMIAQRGYRPIPDEIRRCREEIATAAEGSLLNSLTRSDDFFTTSECRDLLFHPQEQRLTLPEIKAFLAANNLQFAGFALPPVTLRRFTARFPKPEALTDLDCWHAFEIEAPDTFISMYLFSMLKPAAAA